MASIGRHVEPTLYFNGHNVTEQLKKYLSSVKFVDVVAGSSDSISIDMYNPELIWLSEWFPTKGDEITGGFLFVNWNRMDEKLMMWFGTQVLDSIRASGGPSRITLGAMAIPQDQSFKTRQRTKTWENVTLQQIADYLDECPYILRPANYGSRMPGRGYGVFDCGRIQIGVMNLIGRCDLAFHANNPFTAADQLLALGEKPTFTLVDFHAEATSEKLAMAYYLDGRVSALWGTHTHVPTADEEVFPKGTGYISDLGMTGAVRSVLGIEPGQSVETFLGGLPGRYRAPEGACKMQGAIFSLDSETGRCVGVERIDVR